MNFGPQLKKDCDMKTARKIINEYADKVNLYIKENTILQRQLDDMRETVKLNKDLVFKYISQNMVQEEQLLILQDLKVQNENYMTKINIMQQEKLNMEKKVLIFNLDS